MRDDIKARRNRGDGVLLAHRQIARQIDNEMEQLRLLAETLSITGTLNLNHRPTLPYPTKRMNIEQLLHSLAERVSASASVKNV